MRVCAENRVSCREPAVPRNSSTDFGGPSLRDRPPIDRSVFPASPASRPYRRRELRSTRADRSEADSLLRASYFVSSVLDGRAREYRYQEMVNFREEFYVSVSPPSLPFLGGGTSRNPCSLKSTLLPDSRRRTLKALPRAKYDEAAGRWGRKRVLRSCKTGKVGVSAWKSGLYLFSNLPLLRRRFLSRLIRRRASLFARIDRSSFDSKRPR